MDLLGHIYFLCKHLFSTHLSNNNWLVFIQFILMQNLYYHIEVIITGQKLPKKYFWIDNGVVGQFRKRQ